MVDAAGTISALLARGLDPAAYGVSSARLAAHVAFLGAIDSPHLGDVALAFACGEGNAEAHAEFERRYSREFAGALSRLSCTRAEIDEVAQIVRERLFVSRADKPAKILAYAGRGALVGWLRAVIVRAGLDHRKRNAQDPTRATGEEALVDLLATSDDPELESLRRRYEEPFRNAFRDAVRMLPRDERNALRLSLAEGLSIDQICMLYGVHRATIARWIATAREGIGETTRRLLGERLGLPSAEVDSLVRLCQSRLDVGFSALGATEVGGITGSEPPSPVRPR